MTALSVCVLTYNSGRLIKSVLTPLLAITDDLVVVDSGSTDDTLAICRELGITPHYAEYETHGRQMNIALRHARHVWVLCVDSDEILDPMTLTWLAHFKAAPAPDPHTAYRLSRYWFVMGKPVSTLYPVSSPDFPVRLFHRDVVRFNDRPVDDEAEGFARSKIIPGAVRHDTFYSLHEVFNKANGYTTRLVKYKTIRPSLWRGIASAIGAFFKWYLFSGAWRQGKIGVVTGSYAVIYSFLKYLKAWYAHQPTAPHRRRALPGPGSVAGKQVTGKQQKQ
jgi:glycosyltransferase involved in cell wall biosynthesis